MSCIKSLLSIYFFEYKAIKINLNYGKTFKNKIQIITGIIL